MAHTPKTFGEVFNARRARLAREEAKVQAEIAERQRIQGILDAHGGIGILMRNCNLVYYVNWPAYREATDPAALISD